VIPYSPEAYQLLHDGSIALAEVEGNGIRIDVPYLNATIEETNAKILRMTKRLEQTDVLKEWRKRYGRKFNLGSGEQLGTVLFDIMGFDPPGLTETGKYKTDEASLAKVNSPFVKRYLKIKKYQKALSTNLEGLRRETEDGIVHPVFNLHFVVSYRSSSDSPNFQNIPKHEPKIARLVRLCFIARKGRVLVEIDYGGLEVCIAACYHQDPTMLAYLHDPSSDMHRDTAKDLYVLTDEEWERIPHKMQKMIRFTAKNSFVFAEFYGSYYVDCARNLWDDIDRDGLQGPNGEPLKEHLRKHGIFERGDCDPAEKPSKGTFEAHVQKQERRLWNRFAVYAQWRRDWYKDYQEKGWFKTKTGFICQGHMARNKVINYPVQGSAFHCLLWSLIQLVKKDLKRNKMKTLIVGQIHDSIVADVPIEELEDYLALAHNVMVKRLKRRWPWVIVPLEIEAEVSPVGGSWADKEEIKINA